MKHQKSRKVKHWGPGTLCWPHCPDKVCDIGDQALSIWSGSTDSKTLEYQRTNPRDYQIVRTHTKETTWIQDLASPNRHSTLWRMPHLNNNNKNKNTDPIISRQNYRLTQPCPSEEKQTKTQHKSHPIHKLTQTTGPTLGGQKPKGRRYSTLKPGKRRSQTQ